ncbi:MAG: thioredoxin [Oscillospiraceae bacterium]|nr:thioredoxin [Oscillospiraceae bacterium]
MSILHLSEGGFDAAINAGKPALVDFWAGWCGPCKMVGPLIEQLADEYDGKAVVAKVDVDAEPGLAQRFGVMSIPTVVLFKDGAEVDRKVGALPKDAYSEWLDSVL